MTGVLAWLVITASGARVPFVDHARAMQYAADHHGVIIDLVAAP